MIDKNYITSIIENASKSQDNPKQFLEDLQKEIDSMKVEIEQPELSKLRTVLDGMGFKRSDSSWSEVWRKRLNDELDFEVYIHSEFEVGVYVVGNDNHGTMLHKELYHKDFANQIVNFVANYQVPEKQPFSFSLSGDYYSSEFFTAELYEALEQYHAAQRTVEAE